MPPLAAPESARRANKAQASLKGALQVLEGNSVSPAQASNIRTLIAKLSALELKVDESLAEIPPAFDGNGNSAKELSIRHVGVDAVLPNQKIWPANCSLPMGFSWTLFSRKTQTAPDCSDSLRLHTLTILATARSRGWWVLVWALRGIRMWRKLLATRMWTIWVS